MIVGYPARQPSGVVRLEPIQEGATAGLAFEAASRPRPCPERGSSGPARRRGEGRLKPYSNGLAA